MPKRLNLKISNCLQCPYLHWQEHGWDEEHEREYTGYFCLSVERLVIEGGGGNYSAKLDDMYGKGNFPDFCDLSEDDFEPMFEE